MCHGIDMASCQREWGDLDFLPRPGSRLWFSARLLPAETPLFVLAVGLITVIIGFAETIEVSLPQLFLANDRGDDFSKTRVTKRRCEIFGSPENRGLLCPLFPAFHTFYSEYVHTAHQFLPEKCLCSKGISVKRIQAMKAVYYTKFRKKSRIF